MNEKIGVIIDFLTPAVRKDAARHRRALRLRHRLLPLVQGGGGQCGRLHDPLRPSVPARHRGRTQSQVVRELLGGRGPLLPRRPVSESRLPADERLGRLRHDDRRAFRHGLADAAAPPDGVHRDHPRGRLARAPGRHPLAPRRARHVPRHGRHRHGICPPRARVPSREPDRRQPQRPRKRGL